MSKQSVSGIIQMITAKELRESKVRESYIPRDYLMHSVMAAAASGASSVTIQMFPHLHKEWEFLMECSGFTALASEATEYDSAGALETHPPELWVSWEIFE